MKIQENAKATAKLIKKKVLMTTYNHKLIEMQVTDKGWYCIMVNKEAIF